MYVTTIDIYVPNLDGKYGIIEPSTYRKESGSLSNAKDVDDVIKRAIEIEGFDDETLLVQATIENDDGYVDSDECHVKTEITRSTMPSGFIKWPEGKEPDIFAIDWERSSYMMLP